MHIRSLVSYSNSPRQQRTPIYFTSSSQGNKRQVLQICYQQTQNMPMINWKIEDTKWAKVNRWDLRIDGSQNELSCKKC